MASKRTTTRQTCRGTVKATGKPCIARALKGEGFCRRCSEEHSQARAKARRNQALFLAAYVRYARHIGMACKAAGVARSTYYEWVDPVTGHADFILALADADQEVLENGEAELYRRGFEGYDSIQQIRDDGTVIKKRSYSDRAADMWMKANNRAKYGDRLEITRGTAPSAQEAYALIPVIERTLKLLGLDHTNQEVRKAVAQALREGQLGQLVE